MEKLNEEKIYELLGALKFQKAVFKLEDLKYTIMEKLPIDFYKHYCNMCDRTTNRKIKKLYSETTKNQIIQQNIENKLAFKRELTTRKNRNYHFNSYNYDETIKYLNTNKYIHINNIKSNLVLETISILLLALSNGIIFNISLAFLIINSISTFINFECINLQNYNLCRLENKKETLKKLEEKRIKNYNKNYKDVTEVILKEFDKTKSIPTANDILNNINNKEQLEQLKSLVTREINNRNKNKKTQKVYKLEKGVK